MKRKMLGRGFVVIHSLCKSKKQLRCLASSAGASKVTGIKGGKLCINSNREKPWKRH